ncbi:MAG TPA: hypothetical protein VML36_10170 [Nitrospiria bacterium]|nr:hypothetical protein [Nitrospiria bacterium]
MPFAAMLEWEQFRHDLHGGFTALGGYLARITRQTGRELAVVESRRELARIERALARLQQELGEAAYEGWRRSGVITVDTADMHACLDAISSLNARRNSLKREIIQEEAADDLSTPGQGVR